MAKSKLVSYRIADPENDYFAEVAIDLNEPAVNLAMPTDAFVKLLERAGFEKHND